MPIIDHPNEETLSPCIKVCTISEETGFCLGCCRSQKEIDSWDSMSLEARKEMWNTLNQRLEDFISRAEELFGD